MREKKYLDLILETGKGIVNVEVNQGYKGKQTRDG